MFIFKELPSMTPAEFISVARRGGMVAWYNGQVTVLKLGARESVIAILQEGVEVAQPLHGTYHCKEVIVTESGKN